MLFSAISLIMAHLWVLLLALVPGVLDFVKPLFESIMSGISAIVSTIWTGAANAAWPQWVLAMFVGAISAGVGYHYGWDACIAWVHAHYHLTGKASVAWSWWPF